MKRANRLLGPLVLLECKDVRASMDEHEPSVLVYPYPKTVDLISFPARPSFDCEENVWIRGRVPQDPCWPGNACSCQ